MTKTFTPQFDQRQPGLVNGYTRHEPDAVLVGGLPRLAIQQAVQAMNDGPPIIPRELPPQSNLIDLDTLAADLHRDGYCIWLRFDGEEFAVDLLCGVDVLPGYLPRPRGRAATAQEAVAAAMADRERIVRELKKK